MRDNIVIKKVWEDGDLLELNITCSSEFVSASQNCYIQSSALTMLSKKLESAIITFSKGCMLRFGKNGAEYTPSFSMELYEISRTGHVTLEVTIEIDDNSPRGHKCVFFVRSELGLLEKFAHSLASLSDRSIDTAIRLNS